METSRRHDAESVAQAGAEPRGGKGKTAAMEGAEASQTPTGGFWLEAVDGPMDGLRVRVDGAAVRIGRGNENEMCLAGDRSVSHRHAVLTIVPERDAYQVEDLRSTNGTWVAGSRITAATAVAPGDEFIVGNAVVRIVAAAGPEDFAPAPARLAEEGARLVGRLDPAAMAAYTAGAALAVGERRGYLSERHLLLGLAATHPELPAIDSGKGSLGAAVLGGAVLADEYWTGSKAWIERHLRLVRWADRAVFPADLTLTPRALRVLAAAEHEAGAAGSETVRPTELLLGLLGPSSTRIREYLGRAGVSVERVIAEARGAAAAPRRPRARADGGATTSGAGATWRGSAAVGQSPLLRVVLDREGGDAAASLGPAETNAVESLREVVAFAMTVERFVVAMANGLTAEGDTTKVFLLPGQETSMARLLGGDAKGPTGTREELRAYLRAVEGWLLAAATAYQEAPAAWFRQLWGRIAPAAIEAAASEGGRRKIYRIEAVELWERYKKLVGDLTPDGAARELARTVRQLAESRAGRAPRGTAPGRARARTKPDDPKA